MQTILTPGAGNGIGRAITMHFHALGWRVIGLDKDAEALAELRAALPSENALFLTADVGREGAVGEAFARIAEWLGEAALDCLVNNAGIAGINKTLWECTPQEWRDVMEIDLFGVFLCCRAFVPGMLKAGWGRIVNVASIAGKEGNPNASAYSAAKAGVIGLTKSLGKELAPDGICVNCFTPAVIQTDILKQITQQHIDYMLSKIPMGRFGEVEEAGALVAWLASEDCSFTTGGVFDLSGGRATY